MIRQFIFSKTATASGMLGATISGLGLAVDKAMNFIASDKLHAALGNVLLIVFVLSSCVALASAIVRFGINRHKNKREEVEELLTYGKLCQRCMAGDVPVKCPLNHQPDSCPHKRKSLKLKLNAWLVQEGLKHK